jgi:hypothetical protein
VYALIKRGVAGQRVGFVDASDFLQEGTSLEIEAVVVSKAYAGASIGRPPAK